MCLDTSKQLFRKLNFVILEKYYEASVREQLIITFEFTYV